MERRAARLIAGKRLVKIVVKDAGFHIYAAFSKRFEKLYVLEPDTFCSCPSFLFEVYLRKAKKRCIHLEALRAAEGEIPQIEVSVREFESKIFPKIFRGLLD